MHKPLRQTGSNQFDRALAILRARRGVASERGAVGITQSLWGSISEDKRFYWGLTSRLIAWAAGFLITRTGFRFLDGIVALLGACLAGAVIESQRKYRTLSPRTRKGIIRTAIGVGSWGLTALGVVLFAAIGAGAVASVVFGALLPAWQHTTDTMARVALVFVFTCGSLIGVIRAFRQLRFEEIITTLPRDAMVRVLVERPFHAPNFSALAAFELAVLFFGVLLTGLFGTAVGALLLVLNFPYQYG